MGEHMTAVWETRRENAFAAQEHHEQEWSWRNLTPAQKRSYAKLNLELRLTWHAIGAIVDAHLASMRRDMSDEEWTTFLRERSNSDTPVLTCDVCWEDTLMNALTGSAHDAGLVMCGRCLNAGRACAAE